ncbi:PREDICTED: regulator of microtubule dynamics protein 3 [Nanorana parkeri]|uniref:regulator of microtubule dynamics protein 3 n=1 Tax=Nanorana parkeri TaxID=125878 RepID=UPI000854AEB7|nr:PREDICTED: regulator of microtubule dynamics protein 3 [Nanorana parkeri]
MYKLIFTYRFGLGLIAGVAAGAVVYVVYRRHRKQNKNVLSKRNGYQMQTLSKHDNVATTSNYSPGRADVVVVSHGEQMELLNRLDYVLGSITEVKKEVESLRNSLHGLAADIVGEVRTHLEENQKTSRRRRVFLHRERTDSTGSSSIYFTASSGAAHTDVESEGGYTTANAESDYERESSRASEDEEEDEVSCETVRTMRSDSADLVTDDEASILATDPVDGELILLLQRADQLHSGDAEQKREGFQLLCNNKLLYGEHQDFLWRLARSRSDMNELTDDITEKKSYALDGKEEAEAALQKEDQSAECHKWFAILCGQLSDHEGIQKRIQIGYIFKEHIEKAIALQPNDPQCYYLLGRWCYEVSNLGWLERKTASALYETPPSATIDEALQNFLKAEQLSPGFSKAARVYIAKCYMDLGDLSMVNHWVKLAAELTEITKEDKESSPLLEELMMSFSTEEIL